MEQGLSLTLKPEEIGTLSTTWLVNQAAGESVASISVNNLQTSRRVGNDAWGRQGKVQPVLLSATLSLRAPFEDASTTDTLTTGTINYGTLSKTILEACGKYDEDELTMSVLLGNIFSTLVGDWSGQVVDGELVSYSIVKACELRLLLPKASLIGDGVSLVRNMVFREDRPVTQFTSTVLRIHGLRVPTLIGINDNERLAKQVVVASVEVEPYIAYPDLYNTLEEIAYKSIEESTFQTLEALATHVCLRIIKYFILPYFPKGAAFCGSQSVWQSVKVSLEKPTAVMFADAPCVAQRMSSYPRYSAEVAESWRVRATTKQPPYPLQGRLDEWISAQMAEVSK